MYTYEFSHITNSKTDLDTKVSTSVLVDYENLSGALSGQAGESNPSDFLDSFLADLEDRVIIHSYSFFADFQKIPPAYEKALRRRLPNSCILPCDSVRYADKTKSYTDFYLLNDLYSKAAFLKQSAQYVIFSGDGHFADAIKTVRAYSKVQVGCYALSGSFSQSLKEAVDWAVEIKIDGQEESQLQLSSAGLTPEEKLWLSQIQYVAHNLPYDCSYNITLQNLQRRYPHTENLDEALESLVAKNLVMKTKTVYGDYILCLLETDTLPN